MIAVTVVFYDTATGAEYDAGERIVSATIGKSNVTVWRDGRQWTVARRGAGQGRWHVPVCAPVTFSDVYVFTPGAASPASARRPASHPR